MPELPPSITLGPLTHCQGQVVLPGSKSIANRALLLAALCDTPVTLQNLLVSDDTARMKEALTALGVTLTETAQGDTQVSGCGGRWPQSPTHLQLGNAGTAMRPLLAVLAATVSAGECITLDGDARMRERPLLHLLDALKQQGATLDCAQWGYPPVTVGDGLRAGEFHIDGSVSSQFISALLIALPLLKGDSTLHLTGEVVSRPYIDLTLAMIARFGVSIKRVSDHQFSIAGGQRYRSPGNYFVEGDASGASYWIAAAAISGGPVTIHGVGDDSIQGDVAFADAVRTMGADIRIDQQSIRVEATQPLQAIDFDGNAIPDAAMTLAPLALFAKGRMVIRNVANWRVKETDRLSALAAELRKTGAWVEEGADYLAVEAPNEWQHAVVDTYNDHRIAMCLALAAFSPAGVTINEPNCCAKTYPQFFTEFSRLCHV